VNCAHTDAVANAEATVAGANSYSVAYSDAITGTDPVADSDSKTHTIARAYRVTTIYRRRGDTVPDTVGRVAHGRRQRRRARRQLWGHRQRRRHSHRPASTAHAGTHPTSANPITDAAIAEADAVADPAVTKAASPSRTDHQQRQYESEQQTERKPLHSILLGKILFVTIEPTAHC